MQRINKHGKVVIVMKLHIIVNIIIIIIIITIITVERMMLRDFCTNFTPVNEATNQEGFALFVRTKNFRVETN